MKNIYEVVNSLRKYEEFAHFIAYISMFREELIADMHDADTDKLQKISGRIISYDQILQVADWDGLREQHRESLKKV